MIYPLALVLDDRGVRCVPLASLEHALGLAVQAHPEQDQLVLLLQAVQAAQEAPLPGLTPARADRPLGPGGGVAGVDPPGLQLAEPEWTEEYGPTHPGAIEQIG